MSDINLHYPRGLKQILTFENFLKNGSPRPPPLRFLPSLPRLVLSPSPSPLASRGRS